MSRRPVTERGSRTVEALLEGAAEVFARKGYHAASVAALCRAGGLANASFYQYFKDKRQIWDALVDRGRDRVREALAGARGLEETSSRLLEAFQASGTSVQVFREAEFLDGPAGVRAFYDPILEALQEALAVDEPTAWCVLGAHLFVALRYGIWSGTAIPGPARQAVLELCRFGLSPTPTDRWRDTTLPAPPRAGAASPPLERADRTRTALLDAARECFARKGYPATRVAEITLQAGVAQGTFYVYFPAKRDILAHLLNEIREDLTARVARVNRGVEDRLERERRNLLVFLDTMTHQAEIYGIVREAEFAEPSIGRGYYETIASAYAEAFEAAGDRGEVRPAWPEGLAWAVMGVAHTAGLRWVLWEGGRAAPVEAVQRTLRFLMNGLEAGGND